MAQVHDVAQQRITVSGKTPAVIEVQKSSSVVLELRDGTTAELLARTIDRRYAEGFLEAGSVWMRTEELLDRWADVLSDRMKQLSDLGEGGRNTPTWAR